MTQPNPFILAANNSPDLIPLLQSNPSLASQQDQHGYSLVHAATSYNHPSLLKALIDEFHVNVNTTDEDGETCLFVAETASIVRCLVEELHIDTEIQNEDGLTAAQKIEQEEDFPDVAAYLRTHRGDTNNGNVVSPTTEARLSHLPPLPQNVTVELSTIAEQSLSDGVLEPDPDFRRRIENLAAKDNFQSGEGQRELRELITDAVKGMGERERDVRRRLG